MNNGTTITGSTTANATIIRSAQTTSMREVSRPPNKLRVVYEQARRERRNLNVSEAAMLLVRVTVGAAGEAFSTFALSTRSYAQSEQRDNGACTRKSGTRRPLASAPVAQRGRLRLAASLR